MRASIIAMVTSPKEMSDKQSQMWAEQTASRRQTKGLMF